MGKVSIRQRRFEKVAEKKSISTASFSDETLAFFRKELDINIVSEYQRLKSVGQVPADKLMDRVSLTREINRAAENSRQANKIFLKAKAEREYFRIEFDRRVRSLNREAQEILEEWKKENKYSKQITQEMVRQELASNVELEPKYRALIERQEELRSIKADCQLLAEEWAERKWTLRTQATLVAAEREVKLPTLPKTKLPEGMGLINDDSCD